jgi:hypothetical protein
LFIPATLLVPLNRHGLLSCLFFVFSSQIQTFEKEPHKTLGHPVNGAFFVSQIITERRSIRGGMPHHHQLKGGLMQHEEIVTRLSLIAVSPSEVVYAITMQNVLSEIARRMGEDALELSVFLFIFPRYC